MKNIILFLLFLFSVSATAQVSKTIAVNKVAATFTNNGLIFSDNGSGGFKVPGTAANPAISLIQRAGLWAGAKDSANNLILSVADAFGDDYAAGVLDIQTGLQNNFLQGNIWTVGQSEIDDFIADKADNGVVDNTYPGIFGWPARGNSTFSDFNSGEILPNTTQGLAGFYDSNGDASYSPSAGDYPSIEIRKCGLDQYPGEMAWYPVNSLGNGHPATNSSSAKLEVQVQAFAYNCEENTPLGNSIFVRYKIINRSVILLNDAYFGLYTDFNIGSREDDYIGCDPNRQMVFGYNATENDALFGAGAPAVSAQLFRGPRLQTTSVFTGNDTLVELPLHSAVPFNPVTPLSAEEYYSLLKGNNPDGTPVANNGFPFAGDPSDPAADTEVSLQTIPGNRAVLASFGPFLLTPGAVNEIIVCYTFNDQNNQTSVQNAGGLFAQADFIKDIFDNCFSTASEQACEGVSGIIPAAAVPDLQISPVPASETIRIQAGEPIQQIVLYDLYGRAVLTQGNPVGVMATEIDVKQCTPGIYFLRLDFSGNVSTVKKVVIH